MREQVEEGEILVEKWVEWMISHLFSMVSGSLYKFIFKHKAMDGYVCRVIQTYIITFWFRCSLNDRK